MTRRIATIVFAVSFLFFFSGTGYSRTLTPELCKEKVIEAANLLREKGDAAFAELRNPKGEFRFGNGQGYVWVHNLKGIMLMHPIKPSLDGKNILTMRDANGFPLFVKMNELVRKHGQGWVCYAWPKPGHHATSPKVSFVKLVRHNGKNYVVGSGMYDVNASDIARRFPHDIIYHRN
jgi:signal transduction histidine kinase